MAQDSPLTYEELQLAMFILGPLLVGAFLEILLQGVLFCQFTNYFTWSHNDRLGIRLVVVGLLMLTTLKSIHSFASTWIFFILNFKNLNGALSLSYTAWWRTGSGLMVASIGIYVQSYFCFRLWVISRHSYWVVVPIVAILMFAYASSCLATYYISKGVGAGPYIATWFGAHLSSVFAGDLLITLSTAFFLVRTKKDVLPQTLGLINALIRLTFQTAAPAAICAMFNLIFSQVYPGNKKLVSAAFNTTLPKIYAISMMYTLNSRRKLRYVAAQDVDTSGQLSGLRRENVELTPHSGVHVRTQTHSETHSIDVRRMFHHSSTVGSDMKPDSEDYKTTV